MRFKAAREERESIIERRTKDITPEGGNKQMQANQNKRFQDREASGKSPGQQAVSQFYASTVGWTYALYLHLGIESGNSCVMRRFE